jgi:hypothetical protein
MLIDRRPFWLYGGAVGLLVLAYFVFFTPRLTPETRVQEQLSILAREPWTRVRIERVDFAGARQSPEHVVLHAQRVADGSPVVVQFIARSPYTASTAVARLTEQPLEGRTADVLMLPRSLAHEPYREEFQARATHVGVALFAGFPEGSVTAASGDTSSRTTPGETSTAAAAIDG